MEQNIKDNEAFIEGKALLEKIEKEIKEFKDLTMNQKSTKLEKDK